jgi:hypothetical protein
MLLGPETNGLAAGGEEGRLTQASEIAPWLHGKPAIVGKIQSMRHRQPPVNIMAARDGELVDGL